MPHPKEIEPLTKVKVNLYERDYERLKALYPIAGPARVIRKLVRSFLEGIEAQRSSEPLQLELDLGEMETLDGEA